MQAYRTYGFESNRQVARMMNVRGWDMATELDGMVDRRSAVRFPIDRDIQYKVIGRRKEQGTGRTVNISSAGVCFCTSGKLFEGEEIELSIDWPAHLDNRMRLKLVINGRVVRSDDDLAAIMTSRYEFRTCGISHTAAAERLRA